MQATIELPRQLRGAEVRAQSYDEADGTIEVIWTTGAAVRRCDWLTGPYDELLEIGADNVRLERLNAGAAFLNTHNAWDLDDVIGSVVPGSARMEAGRGIATVKLSRSAKDESVVAKIRDGIIRNISTGYIIHAVEKSERDDGSVPVWRVTDWEPVEISAVPVPADAGAQIRSADGANGAQPLHPCTITRADAGSPKEADMADKQKPGDAGIKKSETEPTSGTGKDVPPNPINPNDNPDMVHEEVNKTPKDTVKGQTEVVDPGDAHPLPLTEAEQERRINLAVEKRLQAERTRSNEIIELAKRFGMRDVGDEHVRAGTQVEKFRGILIDKLAAERAEDGGPKHTAVAPEPSLTAQTADERQAGEEWARRILKKPAPAAAQH